ncbi:hypothetical protein K470DRAFT_256370 [Piedraia hortae CBS 480.64]|uniref:Uncharacterized protein n=1 Tax=Piedraia hortae CBS 480.64 TaxID=1314780 RepID=A0A6A7C572_9PEZI|nr:hypothetical protein K470DRAFT_256370 [Piedraia hortae CBS 480.64]
MAQTRTSKSKCKRAAKQESEISTPKRLRQARGQGVASSKSPTPRVEPTRVESTQEEPAPAEASHVRKVYVRVVRWNVDQRQMCALDSDQKVVVDVYISMK